MKPVVLLSRNTKKSAATRWKITENGRTNIWMIKIPEHK